MSFKGEGRILQSTIPCVLIPESTAPYSTKTRQSSFYDTVQLYIHVTDYAILTSSHRHLKQGVRKVDVGGLGLWLLCVGTVHHTQYIPKFLLSSGGRSFASLISSFLGNAASHITHSLLHSRITNIANLSINNPSPLCMRPGRSLDLFRIRYSRWSSYRGSEYVQ